MTHRWTRRDLLRTAALAPLGAGFLRWLPAGDARSIVVFELEGGNDGLNTLIPLDEAAYAQARPTLAGVRGDALPLGDGYALHGALREVHGLIERGLGAVVHGVGYPEPDRSHFRSRDIWHTADVRHRAVTAQTTGWLGRAAEQLAAAGAAVPGLGIGSLQAPLLLRAPGIVVPALQRLEDYQLVVDPADERGGGRREAVLELVDALRAPAGSDLAFCGEVARAAADGAERLRSALARYVPKASYPDGELGRHVQLLARVLVSGFGTRLFHLSWGGFDTHARQVPAHAGLLRELSAALGALVADLDAHGALGDVTILVHSEFGRRVAENQSQGTDHGAAGAVFVFGKDLAGRQLGTPPGFADLQDGDLRMTCDFRALYAAVLRRARIDDAAVLGERFSGPELFA